MMPNKTVSLTDEAYDILREIPKGAHSAFVTEAILAVSKHDKLKALHQVQSRLSMIEKGLQSCFPVAHGSKTKNNPKGTRRFKTDLFFDFLQNEYLPDPNSLGWWLDEQ